MGGYQDKVIPQQVHVFWPAELTGKLDEGEFK